MKTLFTDAKGIPQFINAMEAAQRNSKREKLVIQDEYMHAVELKSLLQPGEYETEMREWSNSLMTNKTGRCEFFFWETYVAKRRAEAAREGKDKPFGGSAVNEENEKLR